MCTMDIIFLVLLFPVLNGVFGDEVKMMSATEGHSVTLDTDLTDLQTDDNIMWYYGPENTFVARITKKDEKTMFSDEERFKDTLKLNYQTGDLIITHITSQHSGLYKLKISRNMKPSYKTFNVTVNARLPDHVISRDDSPNLSVIIPVVVFALVICVVCMIIIGVWIHKRQGQGNSSSPTHGEEKTRLSLISNREDEDVGTYNQPVND